jgi:hypothetical protein
LNDFDNDPRLARPPLASPTRRAVLTPHSLALARPLEHGESVEVVNESGGTTWVVAEAEGEIVRLAAERDEAIASRDAALRELSATATRLGRLESVLITVADGAERAIHDLVRRPMGVQPDSAAEVLRAIGKARQVMAAVREAAGLPDATIPRGHADDPRHL